MTINPVRTRLARASALELRSKICAIGSVPASSDYVLLRRFRYELWSETGSGTTAGSTSPDHAWKVEYSSKPRGVGNPWEQAEGIYGRNESANREKKPCATAYCLHLRYCRDGISDGWTIEVERR